MRIKLTIFTLVSFYCLVKGDVPCAARNLNYDSVICVCNATYCDEISKIVKQPKGKYILYSTSKGGLRLQKFEEKFLDHNAMVPNSVPRPFNPLRIFNPPMTKDSVLIINENVTYQTIIGFGGGFSDASGINYMKLSRKTQQNFVMSYFSESGIEYNMGRVPIGGSDFSIRPYAYNMEPENDIKLTNFSLTFEDYDYKIPLMKAAQKMATDKIYFIGAAWSPPTWMKTNNNFTGRSFVKPEFYQTWADYHLKFLQEYDKHGVKFWGISTGNEPINGLTSLVPFNSLGWYPNIQGYWIEHNLGPTLRKSKYKKLKIIGGDDQIWALPIWVSTLNLLHPKALDYIDGFGIHWYSNKFFTHQWIDMVRPIIPEKFIMGTEACLGFHYQFQVELGSWIRAELYVKNIMKDLNHGYSAWIDWNLMLDNTGGPNWTNNFNDAFTIVFPERDEFIKQPTFYIMGHFSKFIPRGSVRIDVSQTARSEIQNVAFKRPDGGIAIVLHNGLTFPIEKSHYKSKKSRKSRLAPSGPLYSIPSLLVMKNRSLKTEYFE